ncbi:hypothetical protein B0J12DRAFT_697884 [Macrophomina phaseolina]|uniref:Uncharacterized protein n=1 Tax=Macrophomina phaseolina TaxID=35725 RepID=A0ABQ8GF39_9PEZI|nr:hypothetical protein B0J12DRAFT_697884 [Macrophomina phaseolina]
MAALTLPAVELYSSFREILLPACILLFVYAVAIQKTASTLMSWRRCLLCHKPPRKDCLSAVKLSKEEKAHVVHGLHSPEHRGIDVAHATPRHPTLAVPSAGAIQRPNSIAATETYARQVIVPSDRTGPPRR